MWLPTTFSLFLSLSLSLSLSGAGETQTPFGVWVSPCVLFFLDADFVDNPYIELSTFPKASPPHLPFFFLLCVVVVRGYVGWYCGGRLRSCSGFLFFGLWWVVVVSCALLAACNVCSQRGGAAQDMPPPIAIVAMFFGAQGVRGCPGGPPRLNPLHPPLQLPGRIPEKQGLGGCRGSCLL